MDSQKIVNILASIVLAFFAWWGNNIWNSVVNLQGQITQINVVIARDYVPRVELQNRFDKIDGKLDEILKQRRP